ncbi:pyrroline-5-carboxylate reductase [Treponema sp. C6A8]|uniref:pyrroline-5-carboxylate reductase n=1 Tax=Treponema sp. C6A8 TaxID=1410609 RepID=UPI0004883A5E|nr:pyrroline-5-carboxylate reductase [Treponema sp. C6A8]
MKAKISCIGTGAMGGAIMRAVCKKFDAWNVAVTSKNPEHAKAFAEENGCKSFEKNTDAVKDSKYVFIGVKPVMVEAVLKEIAPALSKDALVISMAAGMSIEKLEGFVKGVRFVRIMPNVPAQIGQAMTALSCGSNISEEELAEVKVILEAAGKVEQVPEKLMDCVTAVSGSGPAFVFMFIEALADAAVKCGMPRSQAYIYAAQTVKGSAELVLESGKHPAVLKDSVCSPGGTTIDGVAALENKGLRDAVISAVVAAYDKSSSMGK